MDGTCSTRAEIRITYKILVGKPEGKRPLGGPWSKCEDNIRTCQVNRVGRCGLNSSGSG
jgi:hypothetical protein